ncbi:MAG: hypothetical protein IJM62_00080 [Lachnospiraceae bacterium]|nr:hypothetical protein [Lachnospiraceae bacterium]
MKKSSTKDPVKYAKKYYYKRLAQMLFIFIAFFFVVNLIVPSRDFSSVENRTLQKRPGLSIRDMNTGKYYEDFASYYSDQFVFRDSFRKLTFNAENLFGRREFDGVYVGSGGYLLSTPTEPDVPAVKGTVDSLNRFSENYKDLDLYIGIVPGASSVLSDCLPGGVSLRDQREDIKEIYSRIDDNIMKVDMAEALTGHADEDIYYKTDHHWTSYGAYLAFQAFADDADLEETEYNVYPVTKSFNGTLSSRTGDYKHSDTIEIYTPVEEINYYVTYTDSGEESASIYVSAKLKENDKYQVFFGGNHPQVDIKTTVNNEKRILIFKDSYANCYIQFLLPYYEEIIMIDPRYYYGNVDTIIKTKNITDVMFLYSADTILADKSLSSTINAVFEDNSEVKLEDEP